jgi:hypothetical protein
MSCSAASLLKVHQPGKSGPFNTNGSLPSRTRMAIEQKLSSTGCEALAGLGVSITIAQHLLVQLASW